MARKRWTQADSEWLCSLSDKTLTECVEIMGFSITTIKDYRKKLNLTDISSEAQHHEKQPKQVAPYPKDVWYG